MVEEPTYPCCPVCGSRETTLVLKARDHTVTGESFSLYECHQCGLRFTFPFPDELHIDRYYHSENYISHSDTRQGLVNKAYHIVRTFSLKQKKSWVARFTHLSRGHILDIGCGTGAFLQVMKTAGWETTGLEPDSRARQIAQEKYQLIPLPLEEMPRLPEKSFHAITLWHVLEHVHNLHGYMKRMKQLLMPGGVLFLAVPNYQSKDAKKYGSSWAAYDVPRHLYHFSPKAMTRLAEDHQYRVAAMIPMPFDAFYISLLSEKYARGRTRYVSGFLTGLRSWAHARKHPKSASSLLYVLQS
jgi:2-polyprenyl-3-methyl-5-hydroxy-6-metoxy-1,4-benzoquinol methylase